MEICLPALDGYPLAATLYPAKQERPTARLIVAGATGVPQGFYRRFAQFASSRGFEVLTLDYRGIGRSAPKELKGFRMDYLDWARLDLAAAVDYMAERGEETLVMVGHSFGGHAFGLLPNVDRISAFYTFASGAGWHGWMPPLERFKVLLMWRVLGPVLTWWKGYLPWSLLKMGEDLPLDVYRQWRQWCRFPHYFFDDPDLEYIQGQFDRVRIPIVSAVARDDLWAPPRSRDAFMKGYRNAPWQAKDIQPNGKPIGHMGYFRSHCQDLWNEALDWLSLHSLKTQPRAQGASSL